MLRTFGCTLILSLSFHLSHSQHEVLCQGISTTSIKAQIIIQGFEKKGELSKSKDIPHEIGLRLTDTTCKIIGFIVSYDCHSGGRDKELNLWDVNVQKYYGNKIKAKDLFINGTWVGDYLTFECITIEKHGVRYLIPSHLFRVVK